MKRTKSLTKPLFIRDLEAPLPADTGIVTTLAIGEESDKGEKLVATTLAIGEETNGG